MKRDLLAIAIAIDAASLAAPVSAMQSGRVTGNVPWNRFRVAYDVPKGCPPKSAFVRNITDRVGVDWRSTLENEQAGTIAAEVTKISDGFEVHLTCVSHTGAIARRAFTHSDCEQAVEDISVMAVACIQSETDPPPLTWSAGVTAGVDWRMGPRALSGGALFAIHWPVSPFNISFNPTYADTGSANANGAPDARLRFRLWGMRVEGCVLEPHWGTRVSFPICAALSGGYLRVRFDQPPTPPLDTVWATAGVAPHVRTYVGGVFLQLGPTLDVYLTSRELAGSTSTIGAGRPTNLVKHDIPLLSGGILLSVGYGAGRF